MSPKLELFGIRIDPLTIHQATDHILGTVASNRDDCPFAVTPNVDHIVQLQTDEALKAAYTAADLVLVDGKPVLWAARLLGAAIPGTVPGSDLVPTLFDAAQKRDGLTVFLLGADPGVAERAVNRIAQRWPKVRVIGAYSPPFGFEREEGMNAEIVARINARRPQVLILGLGAPKQENWIRTHRDRLRVGYALCAGATIDFLAGEKKRAPVWLRRIGLEWLHRLLSEPRRLWRRYSRDFLQFPPIVLKELVASLSKRPSRT